jgi:hypothetical protein
MKKLNVLLHETTILDFPFVFTLIKRYWYLSLVIPAVVFSLSLSTYWNQNNIHKRSVYFSNTTQEQSGPSSVMSSVIGDQKSGLSETDIIGILNSLDFQQHFAEIIYENPQFKSIDLSSLNSKRTFNMDEFLRDCDQDKICIYKKIRAQIFSFVSIRQDHIVSSRFSLQVVTRDSFTTTFLLKEISQYIVSSRVNTIKEKIEDQIKVSLQLLNEKKIELEEYQLGQLKEEKKTLEDNIQEVKSSIASYNTFFHRLKLDLDLMETKVKETKKAGKNNVETDKILAHQQRKRLEDKIRKLESDIGAIKVVSQNLSEQDELILKQLKSELKNHQEQLFAMGDEGRSVSSEVQFISRKEGESNFTEFDYIVKKEQYEKTKNDYNHLLAKKEGLSKELSKLESRISKIMPSFEYVKLLEDKLVQLRLMNSTVVSDLKFENEFGPKSVYKKLSQTKVMLFSFALSIGLLLVSVSLLFLLDDKIYNREELEKTFEDLTIIGNTPEFD